MILKRRKRSRQRPSPSNKRSTMWLRAILSIACSYPLRIGRTVASHPFRAVILGGLGLGLFVIVATSTLPLALADGYPNFALFLAHDNSRALLALARRERSAMMPASQVQADRNEQELPIPPQVTAKNDLADGTMALASEQIGDSGKSYEVSVTQDLPSRLTRIREYASRVIKAEPLNAEAYRLLGEIESDTDQARRYMISAVARSRRESIAAFWLMNQDHERGDAYGVLRMADILLRTRPQLDQYTLSYLHSLVLTPAGRSALARALKTQPPWRNGFFRSLPSQLAASDEPLAMFLLMKEYGDTPTDAEIAPLVESRIRTTLSATAAYNIWLQLMPIERLKVLSPVTNLDFATHFSGLPFDWRFARSSNVLVDFPLKQDGKAGRMLRIRFGSGRFVLGAISQITLFRPGTYRFQGLQHGYMSARRGLRWQISCLTGGRLIGQSDQLMGAPRDWRAFDYDFSVPDDSDCDAQTLRLIHDGRSPSEQIASGEIMFDDLKVISISAPDTLPLPPASILTP